MSSPLAMLKKQKRTRLDLHGEGQTVPVGKNLLKKLTAELEPSHPSSHPPLAAHTSDVSRPASPIPSQKDAPPSNVELLSDMMKQMTLLEMTVRGQTKEIKLKDRKISALEKQLQPLCESDSNDGLNDSFLKRRCERLQNQVWEMENFLKEYGLIWVGDPGGSDSTGSRSDASAPNFGLNFDLLLQRIRELNVLAGEGESFVQQTATGAQLVTKQAVRLCLYRDGMVVFEGPFRSYQDHSTQQFLQDLMDGYFPSELQSRFPDGIPFEVHDRRDEEFEPRPAVNAQRVRSDHFLDRLPKVFIKDGHVIDTRNSLEDTLQASSTQSSCSVIDTPALHMDAERIHTASPNLVTLKIKSEDGSHIFLLKMCFSETIGHLRRYLDEHRGSSLAGYDIVSVHPRRRYSDDSQMLGSCGFTRNTTLLLQTRTG